jgi:hypothetical protein
MLYELKKLETKFPISYELLKNEAQNKYYSDTTTTKITKITKVFIF